MENKIIWGEVLYNAFKDYIDAHGWLTKDWGYIIENMDYNDNFYKKELYQRMYNSDFEISDDENYIRRKQRIMMV